ncbi:MAG: M42 family metallopeptidase [Candidatus Muiribacteriota bacterium]
MKILEELTNLYGPAGNEAPVKKWVEKFLKKCSSVSEIKKDKIGNLYAKINGKKNKKVIFAAHMDEVGFMASNIDDKGFIRFITVGGIDPKVLPNSRVVMLGENNEIVKGIIGINPPHAGGKEKGVEISSLFIDTGLSKKELEKKGIELGTYGTFDTEFEKVGNFYKAKAFDDRLGVAVLCNLASKISKKPDFDIILCFTCQEELGLRGAEVVSKTAEGEYAFIFEGTYSLDTPGNKSDNWSTLTGEGPALTLFDRSMAADKKLAKFVKNLSDKNKIKTQYKQPRNAGGTDGGKLHLAKNGLPCAVLAAPCRYIHSAYSMVNIKDYDRMKKMGLLIAEKVQFEELEKLFK